MTGPLFSTSWYRVAGLTPKIRSHARIHRHQYRGETWYVLQDMSTDRLHRFSPAANFLIGLMDGRRTVQEIWEMAAARQGDDAPTQDEMIQLLSQLHAGDVLQCDVPPDAAELLDRHKQHERRLWQSRLLSPFAWRFPLFDPERFLRRLMPLVRPLFGRLGAALWLAVVAPAVVLAAMHWTDLTRDVADRILAPQNLFLLWLLFPVLKALHEFGHAFAVKAFGGEVHEVGVMILVITPMPYVDASSASAFRSKWQRIGVGAAGMMVELFFASLALYVWVSAEPGVVRLLAYNTLFIAGVSTLLFNANPLLRYDGYYILSDLLEIPNLRSRSNAYVAYLCEHYLFGRREAEPPPSTPGEKAWFVPYAAASFIYRMIVSIAIALFIAGKFFLIGVLLALFGVIAWSVVPVVKGIHFLFTSPRLRRVRRRALTVSGLGVATLVILTCLVPFPLRTRADGVVWVPEEALVRAGTEGFIDEVVARPGSRVREGDVLIVCRDPLLATQVQVLEARVQELEARYAQERPNDLVKAQIIEEELNYARRSLERSRERAADLTLRSHADGTFVLPRAEDLPGRFTRKGELLGYVVDLSVVTVRAVITQADIDLIRQREPKVEARLAERLSETGPAVIRRLVPGATAQLPSPALGSQGGGDIAVDPTDTQGARTIDRLFQVDLELPARAQLLNVGGRVHIRFDHGWEPLATQGYRRLRQLFLSRFSV
jgi:putative peptide zinc metalloprotease protein